MQYQLCSRILGFALLCLSAVMLGHAASLPREGVDRALKSLQEAASSDAGLRTRHSGKPITGAEITGSWDEILNRFYVPLRPGSDRAFRGVVTAYDELDRDMFILRHDMLADQAAQWNADLPELTLDDRQAELQKIRDEIYSSVTKRGKTRTQAPIYPYRGHLTFGQFSWIARKTASLNPHIYISKSTGERYLIVQSHPNSWEFEQANGFKLGDDSKIFFDVWKEMLSRGSGTFQLLGSMRAPERVKTNRFKASIEGNPYSLDQHSVVSKSTIATNF